MKGNANLSSIKATCFPPSIKPPFTGGHPPVKSIHGSAEKGNVAYFQNFRSDLNHQHMPKDEWGLLSTQYSPRPDLVTANRVQERRIMEPDARCVSYVDRARRKEIDSFYQLTQMHRDQYKDHTGSLHPLNYFEKDDYLYQCPTDLTSLYLKYPTYYVQYRKPVVLPLTLERSFKFPNLPQRTLHGRYSKWSDNMYNR